MYYALKHKQYGLLGISVTSNGDGAEFCNAYSAELNPDDENPWLTSSKIFVRLVKDTHIHWYNSSVSTPQNPYNPEDLEIVEFMLQQVKDE